jgi:hypothetical protein
MSEAERRAAVSRSLDEALELALDDVGPGEVPPTESARAACWGHLIDVVHHWPVGREFPIPRVSGSGDGDVLCQWRKNGRKALLVFMRDGATRMFTGAVEASKTVDTNLVSAPSPVETRDALLWVEGA